MSDTWGSEGTVLVRERWIKTSPDTGRPKRTPSFSVGRTHRFPSPDTRTWVPLHLPNSRPIHLNSTVGLGVFFSSMCPVSPIDPATSAVSDPRPKVRVSQDTVMDTVTHFTSRTTGTCRSRTLTGPSRLGNEWCPYNTGLRVQVSNWMSQKQEVPPGQRNYLPKHSR